MRHVDVHQHDVRLHLRHMAEHLAAVLEGAHALHPRGGRDEHAEPLAPVTVVIKNGDTQHGGETIGCS